MKKAHNFRKLEIWRLSMELVKQVYALSKNLPESEKFGLISQVQRCSISIPSNIAEGSGRTSNKEFNHFLKIAISSSYELETQLILANELYSIEIEEISNELRNIQNMIGGFLRKLNE